MSDHFKYLFDFELALSEFTGAPYVVVTDGCTHAMELCLRYDNVRQCEFSAFTYLSIPMLMHHLNIEYKLTDEKWIGEYRLHGTRIWDSARKLQIGMYRPGMLQCLSFGHSKPLELGKVGAILLDDYTAYQTLSKWRSDGRDLKISPWVDQRVFEIGYHYCPTLECCKLGIELLPSVDQTVKYIPYIDCRLVTIK